MSKRFVIILWSIAGLLAALTILVQSNRANAQPSPTKLATGDLLLKDFPLAEIATMTLEDADDSVTIKKGETQWSIAERDDYPVDFNRFSELVRALTQVTIAQTMRASPAYNERYGMDPQAGKQENHGYGITLADAEGKTMASLQIGKLTNSQQTATGGESGRYLRTSSDPDAVYAVNNPIYNLSGNPADWLDPTFLQVRNVASLTLTPASETGMTGWTLSRDSPDADFIMPTLPAGRELDKIKADPLKNTLSNPQFSDVLSEKDALTMREEGQERTLRIETFDGLIYTVTYAPESQLADRSEDDEQNFVVSLAIEGELKGTRPEVLGESEEDAEKADEIFREQLRAVQGTLASNMTLANRYFLVPDYVFSQFDLTQNELLTEMEAPPSPQPSPLPLSDSGTSTLPQPSKAPSQPGAPDILKDLTEDDLNRIMQEAQRSR